ncbi:hypothetical protein ACWDLL_21745 [Streptomyces griseoincarnatus]
MLRSGDRHDGGHGHGRRSCEAHTAVGISADEGAHKLKTPVDLDFPEHERSARRTASEGAVEPAAGCP